MSNFMWNEEMNVGVREMDDEHRALIGLLNQLHEGIVSNADNKALVNIFSRLIQATKVHLAHEERLLAKTNFPDIDDHHREHDALIAKGLMLQARFMSGSTAPFTMETFQQVREWLQAHILNEDKKYKEHLNVNGIF